VSTAWAVVLACSAVVLASRALGPVLSGTADLPETAARVVALLAPALLAGLLATSVFTADGHVTAGAPAAGLAVAALLVWRRAPLLVVVASAALVTALLRQAGLS
jgi:branched-subunit amino acid transport protein